MGGNPAESVAPVENEWLPALQLAYSCREELNVHLKEPIKAGTVRCVRNEHLSGNKTRGLPKGMYLCRPSRSSPPITRLGKTGPLLITSSGCAVERNAVGGIIKPPPRHRRCAPPRRSPCSRSCACRSKSWTPSGGSTAAAATRPAPPASRRGATLRAPLHTSESEAAEKPRIPVAELGQHAKNARARFVPVPD
eukprot:9488874-Pyramimonas_sp.AAC.1